MQIVESVLLQVGCTGGSMFQEVGGLYGVSESGGVSLNSTFNSRLKRRGDRVFAVIGPHLWNDLPVDILV